MNSSPNLKTISNPQLPNPSTLTSITAPLSNEEFIFSLIADISHGRINTQQIYDRICNSQLAIKNAPKLLIWCQPAINRGQVYAWICVYKLLGSTLFLVSSFDHMVKFIYLTFKDYLPSDFNLDCSEAKKYWEEFHQQGKNTYQGILSAQRYTPLHIRHALNEAELETPLLQHAKGWIYYSRAQTQTQISSAQYSNIKQLLVRAQKDKVRHLNLKKSLTSLSAQQRIAILYQLRTIKTLVSLNLEHNKLSLAEITVLFASITTLTNLKSLAISGLATQQSSPLSARKFCRLQQLFHSASLNLRNLTFMPFYNYLNTHQKRLLFKQLASSKLKLNTFKINLITQNTSEEEFFKQFFATVKWPLQRLELFSSNVLGRDALQTIKNSPAFNQLQQLNLPANTYDVELASILALPPLNIKDCLAITASRALNQFASDKPMAELISLNLSSTRFAPEIGSALANFLTWPKLSNLNFENCALTVTHIQELITAITLLKEEHPQLGQQLTSINLNFNQMGATAIAKLAEQQLWPNLKSLKLSGVIERNHNNTTQSSHNLLSLASSWPQLEHLDLGYNQIHDEQIEQLAQQLKTKPNTGLWPKLKTLNLEGNLISSRSIAKLINLIGSNQLKQVFISPLIQLTLPLPAQLTLSNKYTYATFLLYQMQAYQP